ncbi:hypothetical protein Taro_030719 [Colocasia esculenta]|uniref:Chromo shadow domain-containing protein n=1 Tax=Colocasia esculenta TaxID=4460 RepID=A0A843VUT6_COLES|nr:hypothetical protein [Colocasia esculenta]
MDVMATSSRASCARGQWRPAGTTPRWGGWLIVSHKGKNVDLGFLGAFVGWWGERGAGSAAEESMPGDSCCEWSDGQEVQVDNEFLKANHPMMLIDFYEQHLRFGSS